MHASVAHVLCSSLTMQCLHAYRQVAHRMLHSRDHEPNHGNELIRDQQQSITDSLNVAHRFHKGVRGDRSEGLAPIRYEETHLPEELRVLQRSHAVRLNKRGARTRGASKSRPRGEH